MADSEPAPPPAGEFEAAAREFRDQGFVVVPQFLLPHELAEALGQLESYFHTVLPRMPPSRAFLGDKEDMMRIRKIDFAASPDVASDVDTSFFLDFPRRRRYQALATACLGEALSPKPGACRARLRALIRRAGRALRSNTRCRARFLRHVR
eukprot:SAG22_NODE_5572_length_991_cov_1.347534_2_plen_151_part_00